MPGGDGSGPNGFGPMTGRAAGYCTGNNVPGYKNFFGGRAIGFRGGGFQGRSGRGRGFRNFSNPPGNPAYPSFYGYPPNTEFSLEEEAKFLRGQAESYKMAIDDINKRLSELEKKEV